MFLAGIATSVIFLKLLQNKQTKKECGILKISLQIRLTDSKAKNSMRGLQEVFMAVLKLISQIYTYKDVFVP